MPRIIILSITKLGKGISSIKSNDFLSNIHLINKNRKYMKHYTIDCIIVILNVLF